MRSVLDRHQTRVLLSRAFCTNGRSINFCNHPNYSGGFFFFAVAAPSRGVPARAEPGRMLRARRRRSSHGVPRVPSAAGPQLARLSCGEIKFSTPTP